MGLLDTRNNMPFGATGTVIGGHANGGPWFQVMLWRRGVPLRVGRSLWNVAQRLPGRLLHVLRFRGQYWVVVRLDPERWSIFGPLVTRPSDQMFRFGPWSKSQAFARKQEIGRIIDEGRWDPLSLTEPPLSAG